jgi:hypothetical protein
VYYYSLALMNHNAEHCCNVEARPPPRPAPLQSEEFLFFARLWRAVGSPAALRPAPLPLFICVRVRLAVCFQKQSTDS